MEWYGRENSLYPHHFVFCFFLGGGIGVWTMHFYQQVKLEAPEEFAE